jgi:hypothetical protein
MTGVTIERDAHSQQFVVVHNRVARDGRLRRDARGLLVELLSLAPGTRVTADMLAEDGPEGRDAIRRMLRDLEEFGYIERRKHQDERGRWSTRLIVRETPPETENPSPVRTEETRVSAGHTEDGFSVRRSVRPLVKDEHQKTVKTPARRSARAGGDAGPQVRGLHPAVTRARGAT